MTKQPPPHPTTPTRLIPLLIKLTISSSLILLATYLYLSIKSKGLIYGDNIVYFAMAVVFFLVGVQLLVSTITERQQ